MKKEEIKSKMLNEDQAYTVKHFIIDSMRSVYIDQGIVPGDAFINAATNIADSILKKVQMSLMQNTVFEDQVKKSSKKTKKVAKKKASKK